MPKFLLCSRTKWNDIKKTRPRKRAVKKLINSPLFMQTLSDAEAEACERYLAKTITFSPAFERKMEQLLQITSGGNSDG